MIKEFSKVAGYRTNIQKPVRGHKNKKKKKNLYYNGNREDEILRDKPKEKCAEPVREKP